MRDGVMEDPCRGRRVHHTVVSVAEYGLACGPRTKLASSKSDVRRPRLEAMSRPLTAFCTRGSHGHVRACSTCHETPGDLGIDDASHASIQR